jgi:hypothetical protein
MNEPSTVNINYNIDTRRSQQSRNEENSNYERQLKHINTTEFGDHTDVDSYLTNISKFLEKHNFNLNSRMFMDNLINTLDNLNNGRKFNRSLFTHILDFGNHKKDSVILL